MISVVIPTLNAEAHLAACLAALLPAVVQGLVHEVIVVDGGSTDQTREMADAAGCTVLICGEGNRGLQLQMGAQAARRAWLLFLHADTVLQDGWTTEAAAFVSDSDRTGDPAAAAFRFALDDHGMMPRLMALGVALRFHVFRLPFGDQGLLIPRRLYDAVGGFKPLPLMEDVALVRAIPRRQRRLLRAHAVTSAQKYRRHGYVRRMARNWTCLGLYFCGARIETIARLYRGGPPSR
jgi:rSAM/selenodomain-associated transferase 2